jgi:hypothetical protein
MAHFRKIEKREFVEGMVLESGDEFANLRIAGCTFRRCRLVQQDDPNFGLRVCNVEVEKCRSLACFVAGVHFRDVAVDGFNISSHMRLDGCFFEHVTLRGRIGPFSIYPPDGLWPASTLPEFNATAFANYRNIDWALDISEAEFSSAEFLYVPGELVRRDEETQFLLRREVLKDVDLESLPIHAKIYASRFEVTPFDSMVVAAPKRSKTFREQLENLEYMRSAGLAE